MKSCLSKGSMRKFQLFCGLFIIVSVLFGRCHCKNWYVIVATSRYWFNYRHLANSLSVYAILRELNVPDSRIIMMNSDSVACDPRNGIHGSIYNDHDTQYDLCGIGVETDYEGDQVTVDAFLNVITGRHSDSTPYHKRLHSNNSSKVFLYMAGHGGDEFLKFHDHEELTAAMLGAALQEMSIKGMFGELIIIVDTCQASTLGNYIESTDPSKPITFIASSHKGENSYGYNLDDELGVALVDRFTFGLFDYFGKNFRLFSLPAGATTTTAQDGYHPTSEYADPFEILDEAVPPLIIRESDSLPSSRLLQEASVYSRTRLSRPLSKSLMKKLKAHSMHDMLKSMNFRYLYSNIFWKQSGHARSLKDMPLSEYFT